MIHHDLYNLFDVIESIKGWGNASYCAGAVFKGHHRGTIDNQRTPGLAFEHGGGTAVRERNASRP